MVHELAGVLSRGLGRFGGSFVHAASGQSPHGGGTERALGREAFAAAIEHRLVHAHADRSQLVGRGVGIE